MANRAKDGNESALMKPRHGEQGYIPWRIETTPEVKSDFVRLANERGVTLKLLVNDALVEFLERNNG